MLAKWIGFDGGQPGYAVDLTAAVIEWLGLDLPLGRAPSLREETMLTEDELGEWAHALEATERDLEMLYRHRVLDPYGREILSKSLSNVKYSLAAIGRLRARLTA